MGTNQLYTNVLLEEIRDQNVAVFEIVGGMQVHMKQLSTKEALQEVAYDVQTIKLAHKETNREARVLDRRVTRLEQTA